MAGLCWIAVVLTVFMSAGDTLADVDQIKNGFGRCGLVDSVSGLVNSPCVATPAPSNEEEGAGEATGTDTDSEIAPVETIGPDIGREIRTRILGGRGKKRGGRVSRCKRKGRGRKGCKGKKPGKKRRWHKTKGVRKYNVGGRGSRKKHGKSSSKSRGKCGWGLL